MKKNNKNNLNKIFNPLPYSEESINLKVRTLFFLSLGLKLAILIPFFNILITDFISIKIAYFRISSNYVNLFIALVLSIITSLLINSKYYAKDPLFLDDKIIVSNRQKSNGSYENIYLSKFVLLLGSNIICIIPLSAIVGLTVSNIICFILKFIPIFEPSTISLLKYLFTIIILKLLVNTFNKPLVSYLRNKKE